MDHMLDQHRIISILQRTLQVAERSDLGSVLAGTLDLFLEVSQGEAGTLYLYDPIRGGLILKEVRGEEPRGAVLNTRSSA
jgi:hypothetical protein